MIIPQTSKVLWFFLAPDRKVEFVWTCCIWTKFLAWWNLEVYRSNQKWWIWTSSTLSNIQQSEVYNAKNHWDNDIYGYMFTAKPHEIRNLCLFVWCECTCIIILWIYGKQTNNRKQKMVPHFHKFTNRPLFYFSFSSYFLIFYFKYIMKRPLRWRSR